MEKTEPQLMSKNAYAKYLGIDESAIRKAIKAGKIKNGFDEEKRKIIVETADIEFGFLHQVPTAKPGVSRAKTAERLTKSLNEDLIKYIPEKSEQKAEDSQSPNKSKSDLSDSVNIPPELVNVPVSELLNKIVLHEGVTYNEGVRLKVLLDVCHEKQRLELQQGTLVKRDDVAKALYAVGAQLKKAFKAMPARIVANVRASPSDADARMIMDEEIDSVLNFYANLESVDLSKS
jgi:hypothetical protein